MCPEIFISSLFYKSALLHHHQIFWWWGTMCCQPINDDASRSQISRLLIEQDASFINQINMHIFLSRCSSSPDAMCHNPKGFAICTSELSHLFFFVLLFLSLVSLLTWRSGVPLTLKRMMHACLRDLSAFSLIYLEQTPRPSWYSFISLPYFWDPPTHKLF